jgi:hypothetical protein
MLPKFLLPEQVVRGNGTGPVIDLEDAGGSLLAITLGITHIIEQESLDLLIWASRDGQTWGDRPIFSFPQKFYCGTYTLLLDLSDRPDVRFLKTEWKLNRWGRGEPIPLFGFYVFAQRSKAQVLAATAG